MVFDTPEFFLFFFIVLVLYYSLSRRYQNILLVVSSYVFYSFWDWRFCSLLAISTLLDWWCGLKIPGPQGRRWLYASVIGQLSLLGFFKYYDFFEDSLRSLFSALGIHVHWVPLNVILPVGISFYTFQTLSYTIDVWRRRMKPVHSLLDFSVFVSFWPHLVAGPILRARSMLPQIQADRIVTTREWGEGVYLILVGLVKKVAVSDMIVRSIDPGLQDPLSLSSWQLLLVCYLFAVRIYCDFSGYTDIARGASLLMGFRLIDNFRWPYFSAGIADFWNRWHISLSSWLRDYLYASLGGRKGGKYYQYRNLLITMTLCGLWHKANWNFILWGTLHGVFLVVGRMISEWFVGLSRSATGRGWGRPFHWLAVFGTFHLVALTYPVAVTPNLETLMLFYERLLSFTYDSDPVRVQLVIYAAALMLMIDVPELLHGRHEYLLEKPLLLRATVYTFFIALLVVTWSRNYEPFFYFQF